LLFHVAANARELWGCAVFQGSVRLDFVAERFEELGEVGNPSGEFGDCAPFRTHACRRVKGYFAPFCGSIDDRDDVANFRGLESGAGDPRFLYARANIF
jgi:hypothetical protein